LAEHRPRIHGGPAPRVERDLAVVLDGAAELGDPPTLLHRHREDDSAAVAVGRGELHGAWRARGSFAQPAVVASFARDRSVDERRVAGHRPDVGIAAAGDAGVAHTDHRDLAARAVHAGDAACSDGRNWGTTCPSRSSKVTSTRMPISTASTSMSTMLASSTRP